MFQRSTKDKLLIFIDTKNKSLLLIKIMTDVSMKLNKRNFEFKLNPPLRDVFLFTWDPLKFLREKGGRRSTSWRNIVLINSKSEQNTAFFFIDNHSK